MAHAIEYDDQNLQKLFEAMEPKRRLQALKGGFRREATRVRRTAVNNLRASGIRTDRDLEKGIRQIVFKRKAGFRVTVGTKRAGKNGKGAAGYHTNRFGLQKPVLLWAEQGTKWRRTKSKQGTRRRANRLRASHSTGRMRRYGFMAQTLSSVRNSVTSDLHQMVAESVFKTAKRYGCK